MGLQTAFNSNTYRIVEYCLLKFYKTNDIANFKYLEYSDGRTIPTVFKQYISPLDQTDLNQAVWTDGEYAHRINKVYDSLPLITPSKNFETNLSKVSIVLKQGFSWTDVFGIHVLIKDTLSKDVYVSKVLFINDFIANDSKELIQGSFWNEQADIIVPRTDNILACQITTIKFSDIQADGPNIGYIYNYPENLEPLIAEKPIPDFIKTNLDIDILSNYIKIKTITTENKSLEKSILDYFGQTTANIIIEHVVKFGNDEDGYQSFKVSNEHNKYNEIILGLDFTQFEKTNSYEEISDVLRNTLFEESYEELKIIRIENANLKAQKILDTNKIAKHEQRILELEQQIIIFSNNLFKANEDLVDANKIIANKQTEINILTASNTEKDNNISTQLIYIAELEQTIVDLTKNINELSSEIVELKTTISIIQQTLTERDATIVINNNTIINHEATIAANNITIKNLNTTIVDKNLLITELEELTGDSAKLLDEKNKRIIELSDELIEKKDIIDILESNIVEKDSIITERDNTIQTLTDKISELTIDNGEKSIRITELNDIINQAIIKTNNINS